MLQDKDRLIHAHQDRPDRLGITQPGHQLVSDIARLQVREDQHVRVARHEVKRKALLRDLGHDRRVGLHLAIDHELRHAEICRVVASRYADRELSFTPLDLNVPKHAGASEDLRHPLSIVGQCAFNETTASAFLEASHAAAKAPLAHAAVRELLSDEIDHARIGWAHFASLAPAERSEVAPWLLSMVRANLQMWRSAPRPYPSAPALHRHGAPPAGAVEDALLGAVRDLIIPGLEHFGVPTQDLEAWLAEGAVTP
jgi:hypothetical protein